MSFPGNMPNASRVAERRVNALPPSPKPLSKKNQIANLLVTLTYTEMKEFGDDFYKTVNGYYDRDDFTHRIAKWAEDNKKPEPNVEPKIVMR